MDKERMLLDRGCPGGKSIGGSVRGGLILDHRLQIAPTRPFLNSGKSIF